MRYVDHNKGGPYDFGAIEMPLGEMFYPSASVGYSRVEVLSIHRDTVKNQPTRQVTEFYTNKDFPYKSTCTDLKGEANAKYEPAKIMQLLRIDMMKGIAQSQGFLIETNDMNGKEKSNAVYTVNDSVNPISYSQNFYNIKQTTDKTYKFNHDFPVIANSDGKVSNAVIGRDIEVMTDFRENHSETITANLSINFDGFFVGFFPIPLTNILQPVVREGTMYRSAALLKLVTHYGILDSVVSIDKGSMVSTKNLVYDAETGNPLLTRTQNEHNKPVYTFNYPAHWAYSGMGNAYKNIDAVYDGLSFRHGILENPPAGIFETLESGDEIYVVKKGNDSLTRKLPCDDPTSPYDPWNTLQKNEANKIWAVNMQKVGSESAQWVFMDAFGNPYNAALKSSNGEGASIRIIRSGKRNMIDQSVGSITSLNNPIRNAQLVFDDATGIIQTTAATFKDNWRVDNSWYKVTETVENNQYARVKRVDLSPIDYLSVNYYLHYRDNGNIYDGPYTSTERNYSLPTYKRTERYWAKEHWWQQKKSHNIVDRKNSFVLFSYSSLPANFQFYKGMLSLYSHSNFPLFPTTSSYPSAEHTNIHGASNPQNTTSELGEVFSLNKDWYSTDNTPSNSNQWVSTYFNSNSSNVSYGRGIIPYANYTWENYLYGSVDKRINVTLPIMTNASSELKSQNKIGFKLRLRKDEDDVPGYDHNITDYRCYWSPNAPAPCYYKSASSNTSNISSCTFGSPKLSYYYYNWGDTFFQKEFQDDPSVNKLLTKNISTTVNSYCKSKFSRKAINPYVEGILGNWRIDTVYVYYGERKENDPISSPQIDLRTAGTINNYKSFWSFASTPSSPNILNYLSRNRNAYDVWVWNSATTQYNRKGLEIENTDPLGRFNSGLYGYNQQLPIAIANNARVREILFDGYEDYDYQTSSNCINCQPHKPFNYIPDISNNIDSSQHHTGRYSLRVNLGQAITIQAPVVTAADADKSYGLKIQNTASRYTNQSLGTNGIAGTGLKASWYNHAVLGTPSLVLEPETSNSYPQSSLVYTNPATMPFISWNENVSPASGVVPTYFSVKWEGKIQAPATGVYRFKTISDNGCRIKIGSTTLSSDVAWNSQLGTGNGNEITQSISMIVGQVYTIEVSFYNQWGPYQFDIKWNFNNGMLFNTPTNFYSIPTKYLYPPTATSFQNVITTQQTCYRLDSCQVTGNALTDSFSLIQTKKMLVSGWVKVGTPNCCFPPTYGNGTNSISIGWGNSGGVTNVFKPEGPIVEGWQRYEGIFDVPSNVSIVQINLNNTSNVPVFFDDIRVHPYNANMKTYVYHSSNLRLMAELDENNFSSFYEYDDDGTLTRVKKETQLGIKTITETRSATQKNITE
jgi:hypothetical protein